MGIWVVGKEAKEVHAYIVKQAARNPLQARGGAKGTLKDQLLGLTKGKEGAEKKKEGTHKNDNQDGEWAGKKHFRKQLKGRWELFGRTGIHSKNDKNLGGDSWRPLDFFKRVATVQENQPFQTVKKNCSKNRTKNPSEKK